VTTRARRKRDGERGALLVAIMAGLAIAMILSAVAVREWGQIVRRDNEAEMMFRAQDLVRGLRRFQKDKGRLPNELKELSEPGSKGQYFVRQVWKDPLVRDGKWQLLYAGPQGGVLDPTMIVENGTVDTGTGTSPFGSGQDPQGGMQPVGSTKGKPSMMNPGGDPSGLPIAGVKTKCKDQPFRVYKQKTQYSEWTFSVFDAEVGQGAAPGAPNPGAPGVGGQPGAGLNKGQNPTTFPPK
jgi:type II secretory pathway pseudopilin PulG